MSRTFEEVREEAMELTLEERSWLAEHLWDSARTPQEREIDAAWRKWTAGLLKSMLEPRC